MVFAVDEGFQSDVLSQYRLQSLIQICFDFRVDVVTFFFNAVVRADTHSLAVCTDSDNADIGIAELAGDKFTNLFRFHFVLKLYLEVTSTGEVDALAQSTGSEESDTYNYGSSGDGQPQLVSAHEVEVYVRHQVLGNLGRECQVQQFVFAHEIIIEQTRHEYGSKERNQDTDNQCSGKTTDRTCTEVEQDNTGDDRRQVGVEDSREGVGVTVSQCFLYTLACTEFFFGTFVNQYVGIYSHTQCQHHTGNTGHRQCCLERGKDPQCEEQVQHQSTIGNHTRNESVHRAHVNHQQNQCYDE